MENLKRILQLRIFVVIAPPSLYITRHLTYKEAKEYIKLNVHDGKHRLIIDFFDNFTKRYVKKNYPIENIY